MTTLFLITALIVINLLLLKFSVNKNKTSN
ncbi:hypothetical protein BXY80_2670 [Ichthyenterobacterium magnum]|uniref:Uncharacterized protein n=1 Tax=Ichthyenterobacterium magnum TaxID=1230530 RepID=A0A420DFC2_9FLAO|nr:hypothetical protein BXY80_2670 [Ichthyenterobacterium magnum]